MMPGDWVPEERTQTIPQAIMQALAVDRLSVAELSQRVHKPEKEIYHHLEQLTANGRVVMLPPICAACGYHFEDRRKAGKPGKCPKCKATRIKPPLFRLP
jgi:predicted Zn-ribbon and HTH transcriptional regulator